MKRLSVPAAWLGGVVVVLTVFFLRVPEEVAQHTLPSTDTHTQAAASVATAGNVSHDVAAREELLLASLRNDPDNYSTRVELARFYQDSHRPRAAIEQYESILESHPDDRQAWLDYAVCLAGAGDWDRARKAMTDFLDRWPDDVEGMYNLGAICANSGDREQATAWWSRVARQQVSPDLAARASAALARL